MQYMNYTDIVRTFFETRFVDEPNGWVRFELYTDGAPYKQVELRERVSQALADYGKRMPPARKQLMEMAEYALTHLTPAAEDFLEKLGFISGILRGTDKDRNHYKLFLKNIHKIQDKAVLTMAAGTLQLAPAPVDDEIRAEAAKAALTGQPDVYDYGNAAEYNVFKTHDALDSAVAAADSLSEGRLQSEMDKELPNLENIKNIVSAMSYMLYRAEKNYEEIRNANKEPATNKYEYAEKLRKKYDINEILKSDIVDYVPQYRAGLEKQLADKDAALEDKKNQINKQNSEIEALRQHIAALQATVEKQSAQIKSQTDVITKKDSELAALTNKQEQIKLKVENLRKGAEKMRIGMGSSGVKAMQKSVAELSSDLENTR